MNIMIVEDTPMDLKLASLVLNSNGHTVEGKSTAEQAIESIKTNRPEVILLDLNLPGINGLELARQLKTDPQTRQIPIVAVTAAPELFGKDKALKAGCDAYIVKPIDTRVLPKLIDVVVLQQKNGGKKQ